VAVLALVTQPSSITYLAIGALAAGGASSDGSILASNTAGVVAGADSTGNAVLETTSAILNNAQSNSITADTVGTVSGGFGVSNTGVYGSAPVGIFTTTPPIGAASTSPFSVVPGNRNLRGARKTQTSALITGGIVTGFSETGGSGQSDGSTEITSNILGISTNKFDVSGEGGSFVSAPRGQTEGESAAASKGNTQVGFTGVDVNQGLAGGSAGITSNALGEFYGGFSPPTITGTTTLPPKGLFQPSATVLVGTPNGVTGGSAASDGSIAGTTSLFQPSTVTSITLGAVAAVESASSGSATSSNILGNVGADAGGVTDGTLTSALSRKRRGWRRSPPPKLPVLSMLAFPMVLPVCLADVPSTDLLLPLVSLSRLVSMPPLCLTPLLRPRTPSMLFRATRRSIYSVE